MLSIETERLTIAEFTLDMAEDVHQNSLDEDNRRFVPDEVFETIEEARETLEFLMSRYGGEEGPFVYPVLLKDRTNIGYVQLVPVEDGWEIGYHIAKKYTGKGYAAEAVKAFLPVMMKEHRLNRIIGICVAENYASRRVMEKCGFVKQYEGIGPYQGQEINICRYLYTL
jgi:RimJ/RimL family protein N-acetyltransferase